jgi:hypothetical protein
MSIHKKNDSPATSDISISIVFNETTEDHYFTVTSESFSINIDLEEISQLYPAALNLLSGVKDGSSR